MQSNLEFSQITPSTSLLSPIMKNDEKCSTPNKSVDSIDIDTTPIPFNQRLLNASDNKTSTLRKPRVNFHSIHDIVYGGSSSSDSIQHDSGFCSFSNKSGDEDKENEAACKKSQLIVQQTDAHGKKIRTTFTDEQKKSLEEYFNRNPYPDPKETEDLSQQLVLPENVIKVWFQNKRSRDKQRKFSKSRTTSINVNQFKSENLFTSSPIVANLQLLQSRLNTYAHMAQHANCYNVNKNYF